MDYAFYLNGVFEDVLEEIRSAQSENPELICYLQPYSSSRISKFADKPPTQADPITLYISLTSSLEFVSYRARIIGWEKKPDIDTSRLAELNAHIQKHQPGEREIYMTAGDDTPCINLISVIHIERLAMPIPVSTFVKTSDQTPLKPRSRSGNWSYVHPVPDWIGTIPQSAAWEKVNAELESAVEESLSLSQAEREQRLQDAPKLPEVVQIISRGFRRNPDVVASVLSRAAGQCEQCGRNAPFFRAKDGTPYLEVHHKVTLADGGEDTVDNAIAVCPNCHREVHFGA